MVQGTGVTAGRRTAGCGARGAPGQSGLGIEAPSGVRGVAASTLSELLSSCASEGLVRIRSMVVCRKSAQGGNRQVKKRLGGKRLAVARTASRPSHWHSNHIAGQGKAQDRLCRSAATCMVWDGNAFAGWPHAANRHRMAGRVQGMGGTEGMRSDCRPEKLMASSSPHAQPFILNRTPETPTLFGLKIQGLAPMMCPASQATQPPLARAVATPRFERKSGRVAPPHLWVKLHLVWTLASLTREGCFQQHLKACLQHC